MASPSEFSNMSTNQTPLNGSDKQQPHFVLVPLMAQGHMIPMVDMAHLLAYHGATVTFVTTPLNASRIRCVIDRVEEAGIAIEFVQLKFPCIEAGLPEGSENIDVVPSKDFVIHFVKACAMLRQPLATHLRAHKLRPSCIISDAWHPWTQDLVQEFGIPRFTFNGHGCFALSCKHMFYHERTFEDVSDENEPLVVPGLPHRIEMTKAQTPGDMAHMGMTEFHSDMMKVDSLADGMVVNSFDDLESSYVEHLRKRIGKNVWTIGPMLLRNTNLVDVAVRGSKASIDEKHCLSWLDSMKPSSVVYVSFGSLARTTPSQLVEVGLGLEASGCPFIWVIKTGDKSREVEEWLTEGFEARTSGRGLIIRGWAPQVMILSHPAVGGFITHCGWNSVLEGVCTGLPLITWPHFADQFLNEKLIVEILNIGISVGVKVPTRWDNNEALVKRDDVEKAVCKLMSEDEEGKKRRDRARELGEKARKAMEEGGSSYENIKSMVQQFQTDKQGTKRLG